MRITGNPIKLAWTNTRKRNQRNPKRANLNIENLLHPTAPRRPPQVPRIPRKKDIRNIKRKPKKVKRSVNVPDQEGGDNDFGNSTNTIKSMNKTRKKYIF